MRRKSLVTRQLVQHLDYCKINNKAQQANPAFRTAYKPAISNQINDIQLVSQCFHLQHGSDEIPLVPRS